MRHVLLLIPALLMPLVSKAADLAPATQQEIGHLFSQLESSGCQFNRNGTWYDAKAASDHLHKKYQYLLDKHLLTTTETFIERAATESSLSGKPYQVKCGNAAAEPSANWFRSQLATYRKTSAK